MHRCAAIIRQRGQAIVWLTTTVFLSLAWADDDGKDRKADQKPTTEKPFRYVFTLSLEELMNISVISVSKTPEKAREAAAAIHVITGEDIRRSGATSIAEALRMAPGLSVARIDSSRWAVASRGFNDQFAKNLLVLLDGREVYDLTSAGVFWDSQDTMLEDIERIEVVRGPGATLWGANAVSGVINIITRNAKETQGGVATAGAGTEETGFASVRYGGKIGTNIAIRGYAKYFERDDLALAHGKDGPDEWNILRGGFRLDWDASHDDQVTVQGDLYSGEVGQAFQFVEPQAPFSTIVKQNVDHLGGNLLGRWSHTFSPDSNMSLQLFYDHYSRDAGRATNQSRDTFDVDFHHRFALGSRQTVIWGAGYRLSSDRLKPGALVSFTPESQTVDRVSAFVQDEITLLEKRLSLTLGSKFEHNDFTGFEIHPSARLLWTPNDRHTVWSSVSRAVRTPSRSEHGVRFDVAGLPPGALGPGTPAALISALGDTDFKSETVVAYELGYRVRPHHDFALDLAGFYNVYERLRTFETGTPFTETSPAPAHLVLPLRRDNKMDGEVYGGEAVATWQARKWWRLNATYSFLSTQLHTDRNSTDTAAEGAETRSPRNQFMLRSLMDLPHNVELDLTLRYVDSLFNLHVPAYVTGDVRVGWRPTKRLELSIIGQNLIDNQHPEFGEQLGFPATETQRGAYFKMTFKF